MSLEAQSFAKHTGMSLTKIVNAVDIDHPDFRLANITARVIGFESMEQVLLHANSNLLDEFQSESQGGFFAVLMRMHDNSPMPENTSFIRRIKGYIHRGGYKFETLKQKHPLMFISTTEEIKIWAENNPGKKPRTISENYTEKRLGIAFSCLKQDMKDKFYETYPSWTPYSMESNIQALWDWASKNNGKKPRSRSNNPEEIRLNRAFYDGFTQEIKNDFYVKYPHWKPRTKDDNIQALWDWASKNNGKKPMELSNIMEEIYLSKFFQKLSFDERQPFYLSFPHWEPISISKRMEKISVWAESNQGRKPSANTIASGKQISPEELQIGRSFSKLDDESKLYFYTNYPAWRPLPSKEENIQALIEWANGHREEKPRNSKTCNEEKRLYKFFMDLGDEKEEIYSLFPHWRKRNNDIVSKPRVCEMQIQQILDFAKKYSGSKPNKRSNDPTSKYLGLAFQRFSEGTKQMFYEMYPHWIACNSTIGLKKNKKSCKQTEPKQENMMNGANNAWDTSRANKSL